jgi:hypothetical protein
MSRTVIAILIYHRHTPRDLNIRRGLHSITNEAFHHVVWISVDRYAQLSVTQDVFSPPTFYSVGDMYV